MDFSMIVRVRLILLLLISQTFASLVITRVSGASEVSAPAGSYVHLERLFTRISARAPVAPPDDLQLFLGRSPAILLNTADIVEFLNATVDDQVTLLRATALFARWVRSRGLPVFATGETIKMAVGRRFLLGLTFPVDFIAYFFYIPDPAVGGDFQTHIKVIYTKQYTYKFDKDIFDANVKVNGSEILYRLDGVQRMGYLVTSDVYYNDERVSYVNVQGIAGERRGALGLFQKVFFFIPATLRGLLIADNDLIIDAFIKQKIRGFEQLRRYKVRRMS